MLINEAEKIVRYNSSSSQWHAHKHTAGQMVFFFTKKAYCTFLFLFQSCQKCDACARVCACAWEQAPHKHPHQREVLSRPAVRPSQEGLPSFFWPAARRNPHRRAKLASSDRKMFRRSVKIRADANQTDGSQAGRHWFPQSAARDITDMCRSKQQQHINAENYSWDYHFKMLLKFCTLIFAEFLDYVCNKLYFECLCI